MTDYTRNIVNNQIVNPLATLIRDATILSMDESVGNILILIDLNIFNDMASSISVNDKNSVKS